MSTKCFANWFVLGILAVTAIGVFLLVLPAQASSAQPQPNTAAAEPACNSCHDNLYYNYDLGKLYCVSEARTRCVDCHAGDPTTLDKEAAHTNMEAHPVWDGNVSRCQSCHPQDCAAHVERFAVIAGFRPINYVPQSAYSFTPSPLSTAVPAAAVEEELSWQAKLLLGVAAILLFFGWPLLSKFLFHT
jgi:cytochrome c553